MATYGEQLLQQAERRLRARAVKRRRRLLAPAMLATLWALTDLLVARHGRLSAEGAGLFRMTIDHAEPLIWTIGFVLVPLLLAVKPDPMPQGAALALISGPVLSPIVFGAGGWHVWQDLIVFAVCSLILLAARARARLDLEEPDPA